MGKLGGGLLFRPHLELRWHWRNKSEMGLAQIRMRFAPRYDNNLAIPHFLPHCPRSDTPPFSPVLRDWGQ